jgi:ATP-dependent protease Clp ATPase subunit
MKLLDECGHLMWALDRGLIALDEIDRVATTRAARIVRRLRR